MTSASPRPAPIPIVESISVVAQGSRAWLVDIWGVMHNGVAPFIDAAVATRQFRETGGIVLLVSNAPRPDHSVVAQIDRIGVPRDAYDAVISSGDVCRVMLQGMLDKPLHHVGPARDLPIFEGLPLRFVDAAHAEVVVCTGLFDDTKETAEDYRALLSDFLRRRTPMICANPDLVVERGDRLVYCAGAIAQLYEQMGGAVTYAGKPYAPIYDMAFGAIDRLAGSSVSRDRIIAIGDGLRTDIAGAANVGIRSVFIASGVHLENGRLDAAALERLFPAGPGRPVAAMQALKA